MVAINADTTLGHLSSFHGERALCFSQICDEIKSLAMEIKDEGSDQTRIDALAREIHQAFSNPEVVKQLKANIYMCSIAGNMTELAYSVERLAQALFNSSTAEGKALGMEIFNLFYSPRHFLPPEVYVEILSHLSPQHALKLAHVSRTERAMALHVFARRINSEKIPISQFGFGYRGLSKAARFFGEFAKEITFLDARGCYDTEEDLKKITDLFPAAQAPLVDSRATMPRIYFIEVDLDTFSNRLENSTISEISLYDPLRNEGERIFRGNVSEHGFRVVWNNLKTWVHEGLNNDRVPVVFIGHNIFQFEWPLLKNKCCHIGQQIPRNWKPFDLLYLARALKIPQKPLRLTDLYTHYNIDMKMWMNSHDEVNAIASLFFKMTEGIETNRLLYTLVTSSMPIRHVACIIEELAKDPLRRSVRKDREWDTPQNKSNKLARGED